MSRNAQANGVAGWVLTPTEVAADLRRMLTSIQRVQAVTGDPVIRMGAARNADTLRAAIQLIEEKP
jgi:hypothetical protein